VTDLEMPGMNGMELTSEIRARWSNLPLVVATGVGGANDWKVLRALGADEILLKPMRIDALVSAVKRAMKARERGAEDSLSPTSAVISA
jgi:serine/threonine-protein kinase